MANVLGATSQVVDQGSSLAVSALSSLSGFAKSVIGGSGRTFTHVLPSVHVPVPSAVKSVVEVTKNGASLAKDVVSGASGLAVSAGGSIGRELGALVGSVIPSSSGRVPLRSSQAAGNLAKSITKGATGLMDAVSHEVDAVQEALEESVTHVVSHALGNDVAGLTRDVFHTTRTVTDTTKTVHGFDVHKLASKAQKVALEETLKESLRTKKD